MKPNQNNGPEQKESRSAYVQRHVSNALKYGTAWWYRAAYRNSIECEICKTETLHPSGCWRLSYTNRKNAERLSFNVCDECIGKLGWIAPSYDDCVRDLSRNLSKDLFSSAKGTHDCGHTMDCDCGHPDKYPVELTFKSPPVIEFLSDVAGQLMLPGLKVAITMVTVCRKCVKNQGIEYVPMTIREMGYTGD